MHGNVRNVAEPPEIKSLSRFKSNNHNTTIIIQNHNTEYMRIKRSAQGGKNGKENPK